MISADETSITTVQRSHKVLEKSYHHQSCVFGLDDVANMGIGMLKSLCLHRCDTCALSKSVKYDKVDQSNRNRNTFTNTNTDRKEIRILLQIQIQLNRNIDTFTITSTD